MAFSSDIADLGEDGFADSGGVKIHYVTKGAGPLAVLIHQVGRQQKRIAESGVWVLPNPSGLNAHYPPAKLVPLFAELQAVINSEGVM